MSKYLVHEETVLIYALFVKLCGHPACDSKGQRCSHFCDAMEQRAANLTITVLTYYP